MQDQYLNNAKRIHNTLNEILIKIKGNDKE